MKLHQNKNNGQFTIILPKSIVTEMLRWEGGDELIIDMEKRETGRVLVIKKRVTGEL